MQYWVFSIVFLTFVSKNNRAKVYFKWKKSQMIQDAHSPIERGRVNVIHTGQRIRRQAPLIVLTSTCCVTLFKLPYLSISQDFLIIK